MKPTPAELTDAAMKLITLDAEGKVIDAAGVRGTLAFDYGVSAARANTAVAKAARRLRNAEFAAEGTSDFTLRVRLTEAQRQRLQIMADRETAGDMSKYVRRVLFA